MDAIIQYLIFLILNVKPVFEQCTSYYDHDILANSCLEFPIMNWIFVVLGCGKSNTIRDKGRASAGRM